MMPLMRDTWYVPSRTFDNNTCVETQFTDDAVYVRNNLRPNAGTVVFTHEEWRVFVAGVRDGDCDVCPGSPGGTGATRVLPSSTRPGRAAIKKV